MRTLFRLPWFFFAAAENREPLSDILPLPTGGSDILEPTRTILDLRPEVTSLECWLDLNA